MTAALIVAVGSTAGKSGFLPLHPTGVVSAVQRLILTFQQAGVQQVVLVAGQQHEKIEKHVAHLGATLLKASQNAQMLDSIKVGLGYLAGRCTRAFVAPVDVPLFTAETLQALMQAEAGVVNPGFKGRAGHPVLLAEPLFGAVQAYAGPEGLRGALRGLKAERRLIEVPDEGVLLNIQRTADFEELVQRHSLRRIRPQLQLRLTREQPFFGPGTEQLLQLIANTHSVREACQLMGISYSKGWKMLAIMEQQLGFEVVSRQQGGAGGGSASLTPKGEELLLKYSAFTGECEAQVKKLFEKYFP